MAARPGERFAHLMSTGFDAAIDAPRALDAESIGMAVRPPMEMNCARTTDGNPESGPGESGEV